LKEKLFSTAKKRGRPAKQEISGKATSSDNLNVTATTSGSIAYPTNHSSSSKSFTSKDEVKPPEGTNLSTQTTPASSATSTPTSSAIPATSATPVTAPEFIEVYVNDKAVKISPGSVIIQACSAAGIDIPRFCYHERLAIAGNCRMCLVQVEKMPKLIASCSQPVSPGMRIQTESAQVKKAREGVMEFLLANHPLDCAICDQGGECDLQDQAMAFGSDRSRFNLETEHKRAVENKDFGPLVKTSMNRCIHCTRCVRFGNEIAGLPELGTTGRGNDMQIGTYVHSMLGSELSANIIDLCPVGALTSKPYAFAARPWELRKTESIDVMDAVGSSIRVDTRGVELMRIQPRINDPVNEEWLSDKSRYVSDALKVQRLTQPSLEGQVVTWSSALSGASKMIRESKGEVAVVAGPFADAETLVAARDLIGSTENLFIAPSLYDNEAIDDISISLPHDNISQYRSGLTLVQMESIDTLLMIGCNMRHEAALLNTRVRKAFLKKENFSAAVIGCSPDDQLNFDFEWLGGDVEALKLLKETEIWKKLCSAEKPAILISTALISEHPDARIILEHVMKIASDLSETNSSFINQYWNGLCWVPRSASHVASRMIGYNKIATKSSLSKYKTVLMIGSPDTTRVLSSEQAQKLIYVGHHADRIAPISHVILPSCAYTEKSATFINLEGRVQRTQPALDSPGDARPDWTIIRALSEIVDPSRPLPYDSLNELREIRFKEICKELSNGNGIIPNDESEIIKKLLKAFELKSKGSVSNLPFKTVNIPDFYLTDAISRSSATMAKCSLAFTSKIAKTTWEVDEKFKQILNE
jgi:NADH dehydrogenase (ubiquinone) Fe-S protein 1